MSVGIDLQDRIVRAALHRTVIRLALMALCAFAAFAPLPGYGADYAVAPRPAWVVDVQPGAITPAHLAQASDGQVYSLLDAQVFVEKESRTRYQRVVGMAVNAAGVESIANIEIDFDPAWQQLVLHSISVVRKGQVIPKLATARIQVIQREEDLAARIFDGTKTASIFLEDVRVGDSVDYSYSRVGRNPVFDGYEFGAIDLQFSVPISRVHGSLLFPASRSLVFKNHNAAPAPKIVERGGLRSYVWEMHDVPAIKVEAGAPSWYHPYAEVEWSEFRDWKAVVAWAQPLYLSTAELGPELEAELARIVRAEPTSTGRMLAALRFAQGEIRYLGVETGRNSHAPNPPALVMQRRFGDCKDKALVTLALLGRLGIKAHAALVNTEYRRGIAGRLPNPSVFDHVLVQATVEGKTYWIDPTRPVQGSSLANLFQPDYDLSLVIAPESKALVSMKQPETARHTRKVHVIFDAREDFARPVKYSVVTEHLGAAAESQRSYLSSTNLDEVQKGFLEFYARHYAGIAVAKPLAFDDDTEGNRITTHESYSIADIASSPDKQGRRSVVIETPDVDALLRDPEATIRNSPLALAYPFEVRQTTEMHLPKEWDITPVDESINDPAFSFRRTVKAEGLRIVIEDHYKSLADEVSAKDMPRYLANLKRARESVGYELSWSESGNTAGSWLGSLNWPIVMIALLAFGLCAGLAVLAYRYDPSAAHASVDPGLVGIGGWLVLFAIGLIASPFRIGYGLWSVLEAASIENWARLTTPGDADYHPLWAPLLLSEVVLNAALIAYSLLLLVLFFRKRSSFRRLAMIFLVASTIVQVVDTLLAGVVASTAITTKDYTDSARAAISSLIWTAYLWRSRRVQSTFVRRLDAAEAAPQLVPSGAASGTA